MSGLRSPTFREAGTDGAELELVTGWGRNPASAAHVVRPVDADGLALAAKGAGRRGAIARGLGRAYGDAAMNAGGTVVEATRVEGVLEFDPRRGVVRALAGTSLDALLRRTVPEGWFVPVTPGTRFVTLGGAIASDVHGKDHHAAGTFGSHVRSIVLALSDGTRRTLTPEESPDEFWATCGGMGLTGTILEATVGLRPVETSLVSVDTDRISDLDTLLARLATDESRYRYSVAWIDLLARGRSLGRAVLTQGDFAPRGAVRPQRRGSGDALAYGPRPPLPTPLAPSFLLNRWTIRAFNGLWYRKAPRQRRGELQTITQFFYPLDLAGEWNRLYGRRGFFQWQCLVPFGEETVLRQVIEALAGSHSASFLAVLKRLGAANPGPLSFPAPGWTVALDVPAGNTGLTPLVRRLDRQVVEAGGRLYLAKDSCMSPELLPVMYPRLPEWRAVRDGLDPERRMISDLARRLRLLG